MFAATAVILFTLWLVGVLIYQINATMFDLLLVIVGISMALELIMPRRSRKL